MEQHDFIEAKDKPRLQEGLKIRNLFSKMEKDVVEGSQWFLLPQVWFKKWQKYSFFDLIVNTVDEEEESVAREHPDGIDFSSIFEEQETDTLKEISLKFTWQNYQLKEKAVEG